MKAFNIRVYGLWLDGDQILISDEWINNTKITKFPGGGLEWGEGLRDGLMREWREEMDLEIEVQEHYYTTDFFQKSAYDSAQVISVYYWVKARKTFDFPYANGRETFYFVPIRSLSTEMMSLPIDKIVASMLAAQF